MAKPAAGLSDAPAARPSSKREPAGLSPTVVLVETRVNLRIALPLRLVAPALALAALLTPARALDCPPATPCTVGNGTYALQLPTDWDRRSPLPLLVFFHGFGDTPGDVIRRPDMAALVERERLILVVPAGLDRRWHIRPGGPRPRDDLAFATAVVDDVMARLPVDPAMVVAGGFSAGGFLTWTLACDRPGRFTGFLPVAGAFWDPVPVGPCPGGPVAIRHVHGLDDRTVPLAGRIVSAGARQGDIRASLATALVTNACSPVPQESKAGELTCTQWNGCAPGGNLAFCTHPSGHEMDAAWLSDGLAWLRRQSTPRGTR